jgi:hypothetical protein
VVWEPLLDGSAAAAARQAIDDIAEAIACAPPALVRPQDALLLWTTLAGSSEDPRIAAACEAAVDSAIAALGEPGALGLHGGVTGIGWALAHVAEPGTADELLGELDVALVATAAAWEGTYDLIGGLVGFGVYFLERLAGPGARAEPQRGIDTVLAGLVACAERADTGTTWLTRPELLYTERERFPDGTYNCGVAHGVPAIAAWLGHVIAAAPRAGVSDLFASTTTWLRAQRQSPDPRGRFPSLFGPGGTRDRARTAWCYGDLGIAATMWNAGIRAGAEIDDWRELALECAARLPELTGVRDAGVCHGAIGMAHVLHRCYQHSRDPRFAASARSWIERGLAMRRRGEGVAGFLPAGADDRSHRAYTFLEGAIGIALALHAVVHAAEPSWDRLLLVDLPCADVVQPL